MEYLSIEKIRLLAKSIKVDRHKKYVRTTTTMFTYSSGCIRIYSKTKKEIHF